MEHTLANPPPGSPRCWGREYGYNQSLRTWEGDSNVECRGCVFNMSCKRTFQISQAPQAAGGVPAPLPPAPVALAPLAPVAAPAGWNPIAPPPPQIAPVPTQLSPYYAPPPPPPVPPQPSYRNLPVYQPAPVAPVPAPAWSQPPAPPPPTAYQTVRPVAPQPITPQTHPGATAHAEPWQGIFGMYPQESAAERLGKNMILRALEAIFTELARFFHYFPWPKYV